MSSLRGGERVRMVVGSNFVWVELIKPMRHLRFHCQSGQHFLSMVDYASRQCSAGFQLATETPGIGFADYFGIEEPTKVAVCSHGVMHYEVGIGSQREILAGLRCAKYSAEDVPQKSSMIALLHLAGIDGKWKGLTFVAADCGKVVYSAEGRGVIIECGCEEKLRQFFDNPCEVEEDPPVENLEERALVNILIGNRPQIKSLKWVYRLFVAALLVLLVVFKVSAPYLWAEVWKDARADEHLKPNSVSGINNSRTGDGMMHTAASV